MSVHAGVSVFAYLGAFAIAASSFARPAEFSAAELQAKLASVNARVQRYHIIYDAVLVNDGGANSRVYAHREVEACAPAYFSHWSAKETPLYSIDQDPLQQRLIVNGDVTVIDYPADRAFIQSHTNERLSGSAGREIIFLAIGWWPLRALKTPELVPGTAVVLSDVAKSRDYRVWPDQHRLGDRWCHVLEHPRHDRLWLDTAHGCMLMAREIIDPRSGNVAQRIEAEMPREIETGIWAPGTLQNLVYDPPSRQLKIDSQLFIREITVNGAPLAKPNFEPKPGSIELKQGTFDQCAPGGLDYLDETAARLKQFKRYSGLQSSSRGNMFAALITVGAVIVFAVAMTLQAMKHPTGVFSKLRSRAD